MAELDLAFQMVPVVAGTLGGALLGVAGGIGGDLARRGKRRRWIDVAFGIVVALGSITAVVGFVAGARNQPPSIWLGSIGVGVVWVILAVRISRHLRVLRAQAPRPQVTVPDEYNKTHGEVLERRSTIERDNHRTLEERLMSSCTSEYKVIADTKADSLEKKLNELASDGWEVVHVTNASGGVAFVGSGNAADGYRCNSAARSCFQMSFGYSYSRRQTFEGPNKSVNPSGGSGGF